MEAPDADNPESRRRCRRQRAEGRARQDEDRGHQRSPSRICTPPASPSASASRGPGSLGRRPRRSPKTVSATVKVLVDTSAWADFLNGHPSSEAATVVELINGDDELCTCGVVVAE